MKDKDILGQKGNCRDCGKEGEYQYEPYEEEIHDEYYLICLCEDCYTERYQDV